MRKKLKTTKKTLSVFLCALVVFSCVPISAGAENSTRLPDLTVTIDTGASVTLTDADTDGYYDIGTADELYAFAYAVNSGNTIIHCELTADIVVNTGVLDENGNLAEGIYREWTPIGNEDYLYAATFNGNNHTISGLYFNDNTVDNVGFISKTTHGCEINNLGVINSYFNGNNNVGAVVAVNEFGKITNCYNTSTIYGYEYVGGIAGSNSESTLTNCYNTGNITGAYKVAGISGYNFVSEIIACYNTGDIVGTTEISGIIGFSYLKSTITSCYNTGYINGDSVVGGIIGNSTEATIANCYNTGVVNCNGYYAGGIAALGNAATIVNCYNTAVIIANENGYAFGSVLGFNVAGKSITTNCYYLNTTYNGGIDGADVTGSAEAKTFEQFASGEIAYLLQSGVTAEEGEEIPEIWGQKIGKDTAPTFNNDTVYCITNCKGENVYSNTKADADGHIYNKTHVCKHCFALENGNMAGIYSYQLALSGDIAVKYYMVLDESITADENAKLVFTVPDINKETLINIADAEKSGDFYIFTCEVSAKEMTSDILCKVVSGENESDTFTYSVKQYADYLLSNTNISDKYAKAAPLVKAMLNYGANTQEYFAHNTDKPANTNLSDADKVLADIDLSEYTHTVTGEHEGVSFYGATLSLKTKTEINLYFEISDDTDISTLDITVDNKPVEVIKNSKYYQIKITDILAQNLSRMYNVKVGDLTVNYGAFSYGNLAMVTDKTALKNTIKALYAYHLAALDYIA
ncbi:MAG: GLUG motif-containing protein [Acutalibacteraceae bacterium]|nr:GLUG motif-containing protein [Acutalibacteraceae bacterium]